MSIPTQIVVDCHSLLRGRTITRDEANSIISYVNMCAPPVVEVPENVFIISYEDSSITAADKAAAEKLLGKVAWLETRQGVRPPQVSIWPGKAK